MSMLKLSASEKQTLIGPLVVGCLLGAFAAYAVFALASEYELQGGVDHAALQSAGEAAITFIACVAGTVGVLGIIPVAIHRQRSRPEGDA